MGALVGDPVLCESTGVPLSNAKPRFLNEMLDLFEEEPEIIEFLHHLFTYPFKLSVGDHLFSYYADEVSTRAGGKNRYRQDDWLVGWVHGRATVD